MTAGSRTVGILHSLAAGALAGGGLGLAILAGQGASAAQNGAILAASVLACASTGFALVMLQRGARAAAGPLHDLYLAAERTEGRIRTAALAILTAVIAACLVPLAADLSDRPLLRRQVASPDLRGAVAAIVCLGLALGLAWLILAAAPRRRRLLLLAAAGTLALAFVAGRLPFPRSRVLDLTFSASAVIALSSAAIAWLPEKRALRAAGLAATVLGLTAFWSAIPASSHPVLRAFAASLPETRDRAGAATAGTSPLGELVGSGRSRLAEELDRLAPGRRAMNLVWITVCTFRRDSAGCYGSRAGLTPSLDRLALTARVFERAYAPFPASYYSMDCMFTGLYSSFLPRMREQLGIPAVSPHVWLPETLRQRGLATWALTDLSDWVLRGDFGSLLHGFEIRNPYPHTQNPGGAVVARRFAELVEATGRDRPFFAWLQIMDAHGPYDGDPEAPTPDADERTRYAGEIRTVDRHIGRILQAIEPIADRTIVIVHGDHGEEFAEHGGASHYTSVYEEQVAVPLVVRVPGLPAGRSAAPVDLTDLPATVFDVLDVDAIGAQGDSLVPGLLGQQQPSFAFAEVRYPGLPQSDRRMVVGPDLRKLIVHGVTGLRELYDLVADPGETRSLAGRGLPEESRLAGILAAFEAEAGATRDRLESVLPAGPESRPARMALLRGTDAVFADPLAIPKHLAMALKAVRASGTPADAPPALRLLAHQDSDVRREAVATAAHFGLRDGHDQIAGLLRDPDERVRVEAIRWIGAFGSKADAARLTPPPGSGDEEALECALARLRLGDRSGLDAMAARLAAIKEAVLVKILVERAQLGAVDAVAVLGAIARDPRCALEILAPALHFLLLRGDPPAARSLATLVEDPAMPPEHLASGLRSLKVENVRCRLPLVVALNHPHAQVREVGLQRLREVMDREAAVSLGRAWQDRVFLAKTAQAGDLRDAANAKLVMAGILEPAEETPAARLAGVDVEIAANPPPFTEIAGRLPLPVTGAVRSVSGSAGKVEVAFQWTAAGQEIGAPSRLTTVVRGFASTPFVIDLPRLPAGQVPDAFRRGVVDAAGKITWAGSLRLARPSGARPP